MMSGMVSSSDRGRSVCRTMASGLQIAVHEIDLLQPAKALADVLRADLPHAVDRLQLGVGGGEDLIQPAELADDVLDHQLRQSRYATQDAVPAGRDGKVQRVDLAVVAEQLGEAAEVEQVLVRQAGDAVERDGEG